MNKDTFWAIIEKTKDLDTETMYSNLEKELKKLTKKDVQLFRAYIGGYMESINETFG